MLSFNTIPDIYMYCWYFTQGWCAGHSMITIVSSYLLLHIVGPSSTMVALMFLFNMVGTSRSFIYNYYNKLLLHSHTNARHSSKYVQFFPILLESWISEIWPEKLHSSTEIHVVQAWFLIFTCKKITTNPRHDLDLL